MYELCYNFVMLSTYCSHVLFCGPSLTKYSITFIETHHTKSTLQ